MSKLENTSEHSVCSSVWVRWGGGGDTKADYPVYLQSTYLLFRYFLGVGRTQIDTQSSICICCITLNG